MQSMFRLMGSISHGGDDAEQGRGRLLRRRTRSKDGWMIEVHHLGRLSAKLFEVGTFRDPRVH